jgi:tetratricopeptide (TPR) repeat protein
VANNPKVFHESLVILDDQTWIWGFVQRCMRDVGRECVRIPSSVALRPSWNRFKNALPIILHWENRMRSGGAVVEEILDIAPRFNVSDNIFVLVTNPTHEDVVYFSELGIRRIITLRNRDKDLDVAAREFNQQWQEAAAASLSTGKVEVFWRRILADIDALGKDADPNAMIQLDNAIERINANATPTARYLDAKASIVGRQGRSEIAVRLWKEALEKNPNYYRAYNNLIRWCRESGSNREALALMQKMQELNRASISRLVGMGEVHLALEDDVKAEHCFNSALDRDSWCSGAMNGLAEIRFRQGHLEEARKLLARSHLSYKAAAKLNKIGIDLVRSGRFADALDHYTKAQYVLPQQEKGPLLFYNIGLCYARWGKPEMAREFLKLALIKEPNYKKARQLLTQVEGRAAGAA